MDELPESVYVGPGNLINVEAYKLKRNSNGEK